MEIYAITQGFKPMLGNNDRIDKKYLKNIFSKLENDKYLLGSIKEDGIRVEVFKETVTSRDIKPIVNKQFNDELQLLRIFFVKNLGDMSVFELEVYIPELRCSEINMMMSTTDLTDARHLKSLQKKALLNELSVKGTKFYTSIPDSTVYYIFLGNYYAYNTALEILQARLTQLKSTKSSEIMTRVLNRVRVVEPVILRTVEETLDFYNHAISLNKEGIVLMQPYKHYKNGRCSASDAHFLKVKPFKESVATIIGINERLKNTNESTTNELGRSVKRNTKDNKEHTGLVGSFTCEIDGITFDLAPAVTHERSKEIWKNKEQFIGKKVRFISMDFGVKDKPRQPIFLNFCE